MINRNIRLEKEEEEQWNINMAQCPVRFKAEAHRSKAGGTWRIFPEPLRRLPKKVRKMEAWKKLSVETDHKQTAHENESAIEIVEETKDENKMDSCEKDTVHKYRLPDISYEWSCYSTVEEVEALLDCLSWQGIRENALKKSLKEQLTAIIDGIARRFVWSEIHPGKLLSQKLEEEGLFSSIKEELKDTAERLVYGNLAVLNEGLERYQETVDEASTISDLASQLEKLLPGVLPQFFQGAFTKRQERFRRSQTVLDECSETSHNCVQSSSAAWTFGFYYYLGFISRKCSM
ncbi:Bromodomain adjacent to zinc finger domain protein 1A [Desmophyllum pertusum]|uniref:Bromodomain adjacent to zinc finger domain protein 1A n=1 Tax=Desmophyllum pertusum TaxID=174260 RepID=A0A9W9Y6Y9_9CNID|nr:Bromodomain adjacent to zinc finger domain protein 1A [Desmophyllum pertusum]